MDATARLSVLVVDGHRRPISEHFFAPRGDTLYCYVCDAPAARHGCVVKETPGGTKLRVECRRP